MSLLVVGSVAFDAIETPFGKTDKIIGGAATYISLSASYFTEKVNLVAVVGEDFPTADIQLLEAHGINTEGLQIKKGEWLLEWLRFIHLQNYLNSNLTKIRIIAEN